MARGVTINVNMFKILSITFALSLAIFGCFLQDIMYVPQIQSMDIPTSTMPTSIFSSVFTGMPTPEPTVVSTSTPIEAKTWLIIVCAASTTSVLIGIATATATATTTATVIGAMGVVA